MTLENKSKVVLGITCVASMIFFVIATTSAHAFAGKGEYQKDHINWKKFKNSNE